MVLPPSGPPPPADIPEGWKAHWNAEYKTWFYENVYAEESVWVKPTEAVYPPQATARLPPGPPPGYQAAQQLSIVEKKDDPASLPNTMAAVSLSDGTQYGQPAKQPLTYGAPPSQQPLQPQYPLPPSNTSSPQPTPPSIYGATPQAARAASPQPPGGRLPSTEVSRDYPQAPQYAPQSTYPGYPPQQAPSPAGYPPQPQYSPQPNYAQPQYAQGPPAPQPAAPAAAPKSGGLMGMLQSKVGNKVPGGANTLLGVGGGLLAGAVLEHEWDKHEDRQLRHHHGGFGGLGGLMRGFGGDSGGPVIENVTIDENVYVDDNTYVNF